MVWKRTVRVIRGERRVVKVQGDRVRVLGHRNYTDATAPKRLAARRVKKHWNNPDFKRKKSTKDHNR